MVVVAVVVIAVMVVKTHCSRIIISSSSSSGRGLTYIPVPTRDRVAPATEAARSSRGGAVAESKRKRMVAALRSSLAVLRRSNLQRDGHIVLTS